MKKRFNLLMVILYMLHFNSCTDSQTADEIINIEESFHIDLAEQLGEAERALMFSIQTSESFNCTNYEIECRTNNSPGNFTLFLAEVIPPNECIEGIAPAKCQNILSGLQEGENPFRIVIKEAVVNEGSIFKSANGYDVQLDSKYGIQSINNELSIIPDNFIWASIASEDQSQIDALNLLLEQLVYTFEVPTLPNGYYGHFTITDQKLLVKNTPLTAFHNTLYLSYDDEDLLDQLKTFSGELREEFDAVELEFFTSTGLIF